MARQVNPLRAASWWLTLSSFQLSSNLQLLCALGGSTGGLPPCVGEQDRAPGFGLIQIRLLEAIWGLSQQIEDLLVLCFK